jgi:hypothetical protein
MRYPVGRSRTFAVIKGCWRRNDWHHFHCITSIGRFPSSYFNILAIKSLFYDAFVRSKLEYCSVFWMPYNQVYISLLEKIQRKFAKYMYLKIHGHYPMQHCDESILSKSVELNSLLSRRNLNCLIFFTKAVNWYCGLSIAFKPN